VSPMAARGAGRGDGGVLGFEGGGGRRDEVFGFLLFDLASCYLLHLRAASSNEGGIKIPRADRLDVGGPVAGGAMCARER
jgi:hypothetical protein